MKRLDTILFAVLMIVMTSVSAAAAPIFQSGSYSNDLSHFSQWEKVVSEVHVDKPDAVWDAFINKARKLSRHEQLEAVNTFANSYPYVEDAQNYHTSDYWAAPSEFLVNGGDCEDYAIIKYFSLERLGFVADDMRIVIVDDKSAGVFHAVLAVRDGNDTLLLDNQMQHVEPLADASQYVPVYSLNEHGWWMHSMPIIEVFSSEK